MFAQQSRIGLLLLKSLLHYYHVYIEKHQTSNHVRKFYFIHILFNFFFFKSLDTIFRYACDDD